MNKIKLKSSTPKLKSNFTFDKKTARRFMNIEYYKAQSEYSKKYELIEAEKRRLSTPRWDRVTQILSDFRSLGRTGFICSTGKALHGIYNKNVRAVKTSKPVLNQNLLKLLAKPELLLMAYREIRGNKGALTPAADKDPNDIKNMTPEQQEIYYKSKIFPDGFSIADVILVSRLIRKGLYPWGASSRIYLDKPGIKNKKRPITIPPFMDRVVQKALEMVLQSIYEPVFETRNRSFGFRPNKGVHDAIVAITSLKTNGMRTAIEGDIEAAYDTVDKSKLITILSKRVHDKSFLEFIKKRLDYEYVEKETGNRVKPSLGIPQGGIDSPYLFNIYLNELDDFVSTELQSYVDQLNVKTFGSEKKVGEYRRKFNKLFVKIKNQMHTKRYTLPNLKKKIKAANTAGKTDTAQELRRELFSRVKQIRLLRYQSSRITSAERNKVDLRIFYTRYADDWILLTNGSREIAETLKSKISHFLETELKLKLSANKTLITDITKEAAHFLGFEVRGQAMGPLRRMPVPGGSNKTKQKWILARASGLSIWTAVDRQRLISRLHMKGYCNAYGFPKGIPMLSVVEPQVIIERYNAIIRGLANYYLGFTRNTFSIWRWIYILRYSCFKTLAQKYRTNISGIFKRFGHKMHNNSTKTIRVEVVLKTKKKTYSKYWTLLTYKDLKKVSLKSTRYRKLEKIFWEIEKEGRIGEYPIGKGRIATVTNDDYLDSISWVNLRTQAAFDMPCAICGTSDDVEMHHLKHIRKRSYTLIPEENTLEKVMALRNRKQVPVCASCHRKVVHAGKYRGPDLSVFSPITRLVDNRIVHVESFVHKGEEHYGKTLTEKGWTERPS